MARPVPADDRWDDEAQRELRAKVKRARDKAKVLADKAHALAASSDRARLEAAAALFEEAIAIGDVFARTTSLAARAEVQRRLGDDAATLAAYRRSLQHERDHPGVGTQVNTRFVAWVLAGERRELLAEARAVMDEPGFPAGTRARQLEPVWAALSATGDDARGHAERAIAERAFALDHRLHDVLDVAYRIAFDRPGLARASYVLAPPRDPMGDVLTTIDALVESFAISAHQLDADGAIFTHDRTGLAALEAWLGRGFPQARRSWLVDHVAPGAGAYLGTVLATEGATWSLRAPLLTSTIRLGTDELDVFTRSWSAVFDRQPLTPT